MASRLRPHPGSPGLPGPHGRLTTATLALAALIAATPAIARADAPGASPPATQPAAAPAPLVATLAPDPNVILPGAGLFEKRWIDEYFPAISVAAVDLDADGRLDVVAAGGPSGQRSEDSNRVVWYRAPLWRRLPLATLDRRAIVMQVEGVDLAPPRSAGGAAITPATTAPGVPAPGVPASIGPWKPRGRAQPLAGGQVLIVDAGMGQVWSYRASHDAKVWTGALVLDAVPGLRGLAVGDIDGDGLPDLLAPTSAGPGAAGLFWARNPGAASAGRFWNRFPLAPAAQTPGWPHAPRLSRLAPQAVPAAALWACTGDPGWVGLWSPPSDPRQPWMPRELTGPMRQVSHLMPIKLAADAGAALLAAEGHGRNLWLLRAPDYTPRLLDDQMPETHALVVADLDGDGLEDFAACSNAMATLAVYFQQPDASLRKVVIDDGQTAYDLRAADLSGDGRPDLLVAGQNSWNVVWYENLMQRPAPAK